MVAELRRRAAERNPHRLAQAPVEGCKPVALGPRL
jgi:hypothetical protein